jgi:hypothetical protein
VKGAECSDWNIVMNVPTGTHKRFYRNTVEIPENSENHLKAIVGGRQVGDVTWVAGWAGKVVEKPQGEGKAVGSGLGVALDGVEC